MRRVLGVALLVGGPLLFLRRRRDARSERVDVYFEDGSSVTLTAGALDADVLLAAARQGL